MTVPNEATLRQIEAADPSNSTWVAANAGSGKTRVLTDRVARLLLDGVAPENILCLTYTKAAATEMQNRLFQRLGQWSMMRDEKLRGELAELGAPVEKISGLLAEARRLFAKAIETPGGLKIQTIHSFCASLLRRFPLEAGVSPQFVEMEDRTAKILRNDVVEQMAKGHDRAVIDALAQYHSGEDFENLTAEVMRHKDTICAMTKEKIWAELDLTQDVTAQDLVNEITTGVTAGWWNTLLETLISAGKTSEKLAHKLATIDVSNPQPKDLAVFYDVCIGADNASKSSSYPPKSQVKVIAKLESILAGLHDLMDRAADAKQKELSQKLGYRTLALIDFAKAFVPAYEARKLNKGWLDFDDLILRARALLTKSDVAQWVLFRLDGGIDHILVDEAQDTSPAQWDVIEHLAREFTTGTSARSDVERTIFVVGDPKQSIYSFQGADPAGFDRMKGFFAERLRTIEKPFKALDLAFSFRSSPAILDVVDFTFAELAEDFPQTLKHRAFKDDLPGRVDLWPLIEKTPKPEDTAWFDPIDRLSETDHTVVLARQVASNISAMLAGHASLPDGSGGMRPIQAKDILVLVQRRSDLFNQIIQACKAKEIPIAGADRLKIGGELAVKDITAVLRFLATPEDNLSLVCALRSPFFNWSEQDIFTLCHHRKKPFVWAEMRGLDTVYPRTLDVLNDLRGQADFLRPFDLIERLLTRHEGRKNLLERLGSEAIDGIDALLDQALSYERTEVPSLTGFLIWLDSEEVEIKRQVDSASNQMRVMTVHGSKGLEAPIVILPDCANRLVTSRSDIVTQQDTAFWKPNAPEQPAKLRSLLAAAKTKEQQERLRLLYVAMTRAEKWLIVGAAGDVGKTGESWYSRIQHGLSAAGAKPFNFELGEGLRYQYGTWDQAQKSGDPPLGTKPALAEFFERPVETPIANEGVLTASSLPGPKALPSALGAKDEELAMALGTKVHKLLEHLPNLDPKTWGAAVPNLLDDNEPELNQQARAIALSVLNTPDLAFIFDPSGMSEVNLSANISDLDDQRLRGTVDRLMVNDHVVLAVDYKTNVAVPDTPQQVPLGVLRQMGAYQNALEQIFPDHKIRTGILWTTSRSFMPLSDEIVRNALKSTTAS
ncbi:double-strand break repair helicase AddA [Algirhabdus cladophorae]|uniref:double-strand break repair helicase AddA n=1 Tax=Algirhabdus cladophorae TaxID=3377108 RepID=UPI003B84AF64